MDMAGLDRKPKKSRTYRFELKRKYQYTSLYRVKDRPPADRLKDAIKLLLTPKKKKAETKPSKQPPGGFNYMVFGAFVFIAIILLAFAWIYLSVEVLRPGLTVFQPQVEKASISNIIEGGDILTTGERGAVRYLAAVMVDYNTTNLKNYSVTLWSYPNRIPSEVFILNTEKLEATTYPDFVRALRVNLATRQMILNEISIKQLETLPHGAVVIIPSGVIPKEMLGLDSQISINKLAERGVVVIYMGQPFTQMLNGTSVPTPKKIIDELPFLFDESASLQTEDGFHLFQPLYRVSPRSGWRGDLVYGSVSVAGKGDGAFVFLPQTLDGGWRGDAENAAEDVSRIIFETAWAQPYGEPTTYSFSNQTNYSGNQYFFTAPFDSPHASVKAEFVGHPHAGNFTVEQMLFIHLDRESESTLLIEQGGKVVSANITNDPVRINAQLREPEPGQPNMYLVVVDGKGNDAQIIPVDRVSVQADRSFDVLIYLDRGEYIVNLMDDEANLYASTYMKIVSIDIDYQGTDSQRRSIYRFSITMDGAPRSLSDVSITVDGGQYGTYQFSDVSNIRLDLGQYTGGEQLPLGEHTFDFTSGALKLTVPVVHARAKTIFDEPIFWITVILSGGLAALGAFFAKPETVFFALDVPDFPPVTRTKIPLTPEIVLSVFDKVNENYRWENTPLTPSEIKNGFKDIFVHGKPVYITDFNVEYLLEELKKKNLVGESLGYYGLRSWENKSKHSIAYLSLMRRLRDICVNNAIPFTGLDESKEADSVITVVGQQMPIHFYDKKRDVETFLGRLMPSMGHGISIILFKNDADKESFQHLISSSPTVAPLIIKMESDSDSLQLLTDDELENMLIEFKSM